MAGAEVGSGKRSCCPSAPPEESTNAPRENQQGDSCLMSGNSQERNINGPSKVK